MFVISEQTAQGSGCDFGVCGKSPGVRSSRFAYSHHEGNINVHIVPVPLKLRPRSGLIRR